MTIRDVDQWVSKVIEDITRFRPHLGKEERGVQVSILKKLGTQGISYAERDELTIARKRGKLHEELTKLDPSYIKTQGQAGAARDYMLAFLRTTSFEIPLVPPRSFSNPDDLIIDEGSTATIVGIVEIKHTAPNKDLIRQLGYILEDIDLIVQLLRRNFRNIQRTVGHKPSFPEINGQSWPKGIKNLVLKSDYRRILYLPADRDAYVEGWEVRNSSFTDNEIKRIVQIGWDDLVAKGGATTSAEEEPAMAIHRPNEAGARSRLRDAIGVPSARPTEEDVTTQQSLTEKRPNMCSWCHELPYYFGPNVNGVQVPYGYRVFNKRTQEYEFVNLCLIDMGRYNANLSEEMKAKSHATVAETLQHFPGKLNGEFMDQQIDRKVQEIIDGVGTDPDQLLIAAEEFKRVLRHNELLCAHYWIEAGLAGLEGKPDGPRVNLVRYRLEQTEVRRILLLGGGMRSSFIAEPGKEDLQGLDKVKNEADVYRFSKIFYDQAVNAAEQATTDVEKEVKRKTLKEVYAEVAAARRAGQPQGAVLDDEGEDATVDIPEEESETLLEATAAERECPVCLAVAQGDETACRECGAALPTEGSTAEPAATQSPLEETVIEPAATAVQRAAVNAMNNEEGSEPASDLSTTEPVSNRVACAECGEALPSNAKFCPHCGKTVKI